MEESRKEVCKNIITLLGLGTGYYIWIRITGIYIPCPFRMITGYKCPGCGISHLFLALAQGDIHKAYDANQLILIIMPAALIYAVYRSYKYIVRGESDYSVIEVIGLGIVLAVTVAFGFFRNM